MQRWLILRGLAREQRHNGRFAQVLADTLGDATSHGIDFPGTGTECARPSPATVRGIMEGTRARWLRLRDEHPGEWSLLGVSLGGMITMQWAADHPDDFRRVVLVNTSASNLSRPWHRMDLAIVPQIVAAARTRDPVERERIVLGFTTRLAPNLDLVAREWSRYGQESPTPVATLVRQLAAASRFRAPARLAVPTLVVTAARDPLAHPICGERLAAHFGAPLAQHPHAGHDLPLDDGPWLAAQVRAWSTATSA
jgi:pimeloyl-ACP methyl ester carboxylesterase